MANTDIGPGFSSGLFRRSRRPPEDSETSVLQQTIDSSTWALELREMSFDERFVHEFNGLSSLSDGRNPFFESEFQIAGKDRVLPAGTRQLLLGETVGEETGLRAYVPISRERVGIPRHAVWRAASHSFAPLSLPLIEFSDREEICERLAEMIPNLPALEGNPVLFEDIPVNDPIVAALRESLEKNGLASRCFATHERAMLAPIKSDGRPSETFLQDFLPRKKRHELNRLRRRLEEVGQLHLDIAADFEAIRLRFEEFLLLETRGWKGRRGTSLHIIRQTAAFARQTVTALARQRRSIIMSLRLDNRPIASLILLRSGNHYYPWKITFDENYRGYSPGSQLMLDATCYLLDRPGFAGADSLSATKSWIGHLWPERGEFGCLIAATKKGDAENIGSIETALKRKLRCVSFLKRLARR